MPTVDERLTFDSSSHSYDLDGRKLPGVTAILRAAGLLDAFASIPDEYRERGARIHRAIAYDIEGDLGECDPADLLYVEAARRARKELDIVIERAEYLCCAPALGFATHVDVLGTIDGKRTIVNWKTSSSVARVYAVQMAGEAIAAYGALGYTTNRVGIHLTSDGKYAARHYRDREDFNIFMAALRIWRFKENEK